MRVQMSVRMYQAQGRGAKEPGRVHPRVQKEVRHDQGTADEGHADQEGGVGQIRCVGDLK